MIARRAIARSRIKTDSPFLFLMTDRLKSKSDRPSDQIPNTAMIVRSATASVKKERSPLKP
ncbi:hypothetical protein [Microcoleus sp. CAWBG58]|uniref:hypothetical protein n=1 Tax=Microcoleus sp. CAWBG58 TaxID=2841651 RepID=UPI0025D7D48D|nr:hypothetical protein [Microcoleus sp. CAWBG58]